MNQDLKPKPNQTKKGGGKTKPAANPRRTLTGNIIAKPLTIRTT